MSQPTTARLAIVDALRGFALFGILVVNIVYFANPLGVDPLTLAHGTLDEIAVWALHGLFEAKFYVLFSFLFGFGLAVQMERAADDPARLRPRFLRRLFGLLVLGIAHAVLCFAGDILVSYALMGFVLWRLRAWEEWRLERLAFGLLGVACVLALFAGLATGLGDQAAVDADLNAAAANATAAYRGAFADAVAQRIRDLGIIYASTAVLTWPIVLALFALGRAAGSAGLLSGSWRLQELVPLRWSTILAIAIAGNIVYALFSRSTEHWLLAAAGFAALPVAGPLLTLVYVRALWLFVERHPQALLTRALQAAGQLSLSNYLTQGIVCAWIFNGYGLGLYGRLGPAALMAMALGIYVCQLAVSLWWLRIFRIGPAEWLLRAFTDLRAPSAR